MKKKHGGGGSPPPEIFRIFHKIFFTFLTKFDNDYFQIMKNNTGGLGGGAPQKIFATLQAKILLTSQKNANQQGGGVKTSVKISRDITVVSLQGFGSPFDSLGKR